MKKIFFVIFCLFFNGIITPIPYTFSNLENNQYFTQFDLLENYLVQHKEKIIRFQEKYNIQENKDLENLLIEIENITRISQKIRNKKIEGYDISEVSSHIIQRVKAINIELKNILTQEKEKYQIQLEKKHKTYGNIGIKAGNHLIKIIEKLANTVTQSSIEIEKKMKIVIHLKNLQKNAQKLRDFENNNYENEETLQADFVNILKEIRDDMSNVKNILKST